MKYFYIKIYKEFSSNYNKLSTENYKNSGRKLCLNFESDNVIYFINKSSDGYTDAKENKIVLYGENNLGEDISVEFVIDKNGKYFSEDAVFSKIKKLEGYLNIKDIYEEPCVLSLTELNPINERDINTGKVAQIYGEANGTFIISSGE